MKIFLWIVAISLTIIGIIISIIFFKSISQEYTYGNTPILMTESGQVGDFIGGVVGTVFSLAGFILLLITLNVQSKSSYIEQFEIKIFELIKLHRDNISEFHITRKILDSDIITEVEFPNRRAFKLILSDFISCRNELRQLIQKFKLEDIYEENYLQETLTLLKVNKEHPRLLSYTRINIAYCIMFYGVSKEGYTILLNIFKNKYKLEFITVVLNYIRMKPIENSNEWNQWREIKKVNNVNKRFEIIKEILNYRKSKKGTPPDFYYDNDYIKYYGGQQHRLGHYYRHLYQSINYINSQKHLTKKQKYSYAKTFRAQLSTYEQELLFVNSLSLLGLSWELKPKIKKSFFSFINEKKRRKNAKLITNYNLIKNVPGNHLFGINYKDYYPEIDYESA